MDTPATLRYLFYPPLGYRYLAFHERVSFSVNPAAWAVDLAMLSYGQDGESPMGWDGANGVAARLSATSFSAQKVGDWSGRGPQGYLAVNQHLAVLAFRGTEADDWMDLLDNLNLRPAAEHWEPGLPGSGLLRDVNAVLANGAMVHVGFQNALNEVWPRVVSLLSEVPANLPLLLCGHSLGGAMAMLTASRLAPRPVPPLVYTFGCPRVGNREWGQRSLEGTAEMVFRYVNDDDIIAAVPPSMMGYVHTPALVHRLHAAGPGTEDTADPSVSLFEVSAAVAELTAWRFVHQNLDTAVRQPRLAAHSPGRYLARLTTGL